MTEPQMGGTYDELLAVARSAERRGLVSFARSDHYYSAAEPAHDATDAFATLAGLARDTDSIRLCVLVTPISFRHPAVIAKNATTIDQMSGGRFDLGVGTGWMAEEHEAYGLELWPLEERFDHLEDAVGYLLAAFGKQPAYHAGPHYGLEADVKPGKTGRLPLILGGTGRKRTPTLAGRHADEYNMSPAPVEAIQENVATMRVAAESAGRDPSKIVASVMGSVLVGHDEGAYRDHLYEAALRRNTEAEALEERFREIGIPIGGPDRAQSLLAEWEEAGIEKFYMRHMELDDLDLLEERLDTLGA